MALDIGAVFKIKAGVEGTDQIRRLNSELKRTEDAGGSLGRTFAGLKGQLLGAFSVAAVGAFFKSAVEGAMQAEQASARLTATLRATGYSAGLTKKELDDLADSMANSTQFDDESVRNASATLLKFGNIQKGVFEEGIKLSADLASLMGTDIVDAAQIVGKALASPAEGMGALERKTGQFTGSQKDAIKAMAEAGNIAGAQSRILEILRGKIGGTADEMNTGLTKATHDLKKAWDEMLESFGKTELVSGKNGGGGFMGFLKQSLVDIKAIIDNGDWWDKLKAIGKFSLGFRGFEVGSGAGSRMASGIIGGQGNTEAEKAAAGAAAERAQQVAEAAAARLKKQQEEAAKAAEALRKQQEGAYDSHIKQLQNELDSTKQLSETAKVLLDIDRGRYGALSADRKKALMDAAREVDLAKEKKELADETEKGRAKNIADQDREAERVRDLVEGYKNLADPVREYRMELERIQELWLQGLLSDDEAFAASDKIKEKIKDLQTLGETGTDAFKELQQAVEGWGRAASDAFVDWAFGAKTSIRDVVATFLKEIARMVVYKNLFQPMAQAGASWLSSFIPGGFKFHSGGVVGAGGTPVAIGAGAWAGAPRMHGGGIAGLRSDEVPAILQKGEKVLARGQSGGGVTFNIPVTVNQNGGAGGADPRMLAQMVGAKVREVLVDESRSGGMLAGLRG